MNRVIVVFYAMCYALSVKLLILYSPNTEFATDVEAFADAFRRQHDIMGSRKIELVSVNTRDGAATASLYDIMAFPSILALADDGQVLNAWQGMPLPLQDEVAGYLYS